MDSNVARRAVLVAGIGHIVSLRKARHAASGAAESACAVMAFKTERERDRAAQQPRVRRSMRIVTHFATLDADWRMLESKGTAFVGMTLETRLLVYERLPDESGPRSHAPGWSQAAVRVMAIAAGHESFVHPMLEGHGEIGSNVCVAAVAEFRFSLCE